MEFAERVRKNLEGKLCKEEGNCGTCHKVLREITNQGGKAMCLERPDGIASIIYDDEGNIVGRGEGITWPPAVLFAQAEGGFLPKDIENEIFKSLECIIDMERVAGIYGYGRVVTPVAAAYTEVWKEGGRVGIKRNAWGITVTFCDTDGKEICTGPISYCPTCGTAATIPWAPELAEKIKELLKDKRNEELLGKGIGTVCAFSSMIYAAAKSIELKSEIEVFKSKRKRAINARYC